MSFPLYFDEHVQVELAEILNGRGFDVLTARAAGRANVGIPDHEQLAFATSLGRVYFTYDVGDFMRICREWQETGRTHTGIVIGQQRRPMYQIPRLLHLFELYPDGFPPDLCMQLPSTGG